MPNPTYRVHLIGRGARRSSVGMASYQSGKTLRVKSVVSAAAYRSGEPLHDRQQEVTYDYADREDVKYVALLAPDHSPAWAYEREELWNRVEQREQRKDSQLARSVVLALPRELSLDANIALLKEHVHDTFIAQGMVADIAVHVKDASDGLPQPHGHILLTLREIEPSGEWAARKNREWNHPSLVGQWRESWEQLQNAYLEDAGEDARVCMASYEKQGINRVPTQHMGQRAWDLEQEGFRTRIGEINRDIAQENLMRGVIDTMIASQGSREASQERMWEQEWDKAIDAPEQADMPLIPPDEIARLDEQARDTLERGSERGVDHV
ncbi:MAG: MobQ family relaxase [Chloroflexota bacterium]